MLKSPMFKYLNRLLFEEVGVWYYTVSSDQNVNSWTRFTEQLEGKVNGLEFSNLIHSKLFNTVLLKSKIRDFTVKAVRFLTCFLFLLGVGVIFFAVFSLPEQIDWRIYIPILSSVLLACWLAYQLDRRSELTREGYLTLVAEEDRPIAIRTLDAIATILDKHTFAFKDRAGVFKDLPPEFINAENILLFLLGEEKHRAAIPFSGPYPKGQLYISTRSRWIAAQKVMLGDFGLWLKVEARKATDKETQKFEKDLSVALSGNDEVKDYPSYRDFIKGKNTDFRNWYVELLKVMNAN